MTTTATRLRGTGHLGYGQTFNREPETARKARRLVHLAMTGWGLSEGAADMAALVLSELVTNAVRHTQSHLLLVVVECPALDCVRLAVVDRDAHRLPVMRTAANDSTSGRGLVLVHTLTDRWGCDLLGPPMRPTRKRVWAEQQVDENRKRSLKDLNRY